MKLLNYETIKESNYEGFILEDAPERVIQFGEGNFLRGFVDHFIDVMNEKVNFNSKVVVVQPLENEMMKKMFDDQQSLYTLYLRGFQDGKRVDDKRVISCISRCLSPEKDFEAIQTCAENPELRFVVSNTTEAGITYDPSCQFTDQPASSFPGKLTQFLYHRFETFKTGHGMVILSCELIDNNGKELEKCVLQYVKQWNLGEAFENWIQQENIFCSTLVDRIVTGYPRNEIESINAENGYCDNLVDTAEIFGFWAIEGPASLNNELKFKEAGCPVVITDNHKPYKERKVRILNGAHTSFVLGAYLAGQDIVRDCMEDDTIQSFMNKTLYDEIIPTLSLPESELKEFASAVTERFKNPFIDHKLLDITLNSTSKWKARVMPSLKGYIEKTGELPKCICASFAYYIQFYRGTEMSDAGLVATRNGETYVIKDDKTVLNFYFEHKDDALAELVNAVCSNVDFWGEDLTKLPNFEKDVVTYLEVIQNQGAEALMKLVLNK